MAASIKFSPMLVKAIRSEIQIQAADLGDALEGVEEIIGDNLTGEAAAEFQALIKAYGFDKVTKEIKRSFL